MHPLVLVSLEDMTLCVRARARYCPRARPSGQVAGSVCGGRIPGLERRLARPGPGWVGQRRFGMLRACSHLRVRGVAELDSGSSRARSWVGTELQPPAASSLSIPLLPPSTGLAVATASLGTVVRVEGLVRLQPAGRRRARECGECARPA